MTLPRKLLSAALLLAATVTHAAQSRFSVGPFGVLVLEIPEGWTAASQGESSPGGRAITVTPPGDAQLILLLTPLPVSEKKDSVEAAQQTLEALKPRLAATAVESSLPVRTMSGPGVRAFYLSATDKTVTNPTPDNFKFVDQGASAMGGILVTFTILTNDKDGAERLAAREIVRTATLAPPLPPKQSPEGTVRLRAPGPKWSLAIDLPGFDLEPIQIREDPPGTKLSGQNRTTHMIITAFIETSKPGWTAVDHREDAWRTMQTASPMERQNIKRSERGAMALMEYFVPTYKGQSVQQKSMNAYLVRDGFWIDVHLSKVEYMLDDDALFEKILESVRIVD